MFTEAAARAWHCAARLLGWRPDDFWNATPRELVDALRLPADTAESPSAAEIDVLLQRFPD